jgi:hypothetical protein
MADSDVIVVGAGLAGLAATAELAEAGRKVLLLDQEPESSLGGQAHWSLGGLFLVGSPEQRRTGIRDSRELAWQDWQGSAGFDRGIDDPAGADYWAYRWAQAYVDFAATEKRSWLHAMGVRWFPVVGWAERGGYLADGHGNSVPRFHVTWGTGPGVVAPFERRVRAAVASGRVGLRFRHRVDELTWAGGGLDGVRGAVLEPSFAARGTRSSRTEMGQFELRAPVVLVTSGGIGANHDLIRANWPARLGPAPGRMISGVPEHVDGRMLAIVARAGGRIVNPDRMWHYTEGIENWQPIWLDSAGAECTATARWRVRSSAAACSLAVRRASPPPASRRHRPPAALRQCGLSAGLPVLALDEGHDVVGVQIREGTPQPGPGHGPTPDHVPGEQGHTAHAEDGQNPRAERGAAGKSRPEGHG